MATMMVAVMKRDMESYIQHNWKLGISTIDFQSEVFQMSYPIFNKAETALDGMIFICVFP